MPQWALSFIAKQMSPNTNTDTNTDTNTNTNLTWKYTLMLLNVIAKLLLSNTQVELMRQWALSFSYQPNVIHLSQKKTLLSDKDNGDEDLGDNDRKLWQRGPAVSAPTSEKSSTAMGNGNGQ